MVIADQVGLTQTWGQRLRGLLGTTGLTVHEGLYIRPCHQVHMRGMMYALAAIYCDRQGRVLTAVLLQPGQRGPWLWRAAAVAELSPHALSRVAVGDQVQWLPTVKRRDIHG